MKRLTQLFNSCKRELFISSLALLGLLVFIPTFTYAYFANDLKTKDAIMNKNDTGVILLDRNNKPFFTFYQAKYRQTIPLSQISKPMQEAIIASEDKDFYKHSGFSLPSIIRAFYIDLTHKDVLLGGSTITQQLVKNALLNSNRTYLRKIQELVLAQEIERRYSKDEILEMYLNSVYFGEGAVGIENAAHTYFGKSAKDLTVSESAFLTAVLPSPSMFSPSSANLLQAKAHRNIIIEKMYEQGYITKEQLAQAAASPLAFHIEPTDINSRAPHFALMVKDALIKRYGENRLSRSGFRVRTTIDLAWQDKAEAAVAKQVAAIKGDNVSNGAAVVMDPKTGDIKALVGSANWYDNSFGKVNMATTPRSVGSSFKPIVYAAAMEEHLITPASILRDEPTTFPDGYKPLDYDRKFRGPVTVRRALSNSLNIPAVEVMQHVGLGNALEMANRLGITTLQDPTQYGLSLVLGAGEVPLIELTNVYATFANQGVRAEPRIILAVMDKNGNTIYSQPVKQQQVLEPQVAFLISSILSDNNARAEEFGNVLNISRTAAVKTGTAEDYKDALTMGYTPSLAIGVWVGNNDNEPMDTVAGSLGAAPIWKDLMEEYLAGTQVEAFAPPPGVVQLAACGRSEYFIDGTQTIVRCPAPPKPSETPTPPTSEVAGTKQFDPQVLQQQVEVKIKKQFQQTQPIPQAQAHGKQGKN